MPFNRPSLPDLIELSAQDIEARLPGLDARARRSNLSVLAHVLAGGIHGLYGYLDWLSKQTLPDTADGEFLERWAHLLGMQNRKPATFFEFKKFFQTETSIPMLNIAAGELILQTTDGKRYELVQDTVDGCYYPPVGGALPPLFRALDAGPEFDLDTNQIYALTPVSPVAGFVSMGQTSPVLYPSSPIESDASLRERVLSRLRQAPHGGAEFDYRNWALEYPGVTDAWITPEGDGPGSVDVRVAFNSDSDTDLLGRWRVSGVYDEVRDYIEARRPVTARVRVLSPTAYHVHISAILLDADGLNETDTGLRLAVSDALKRVLMQCSPGDRLSYGRLFTAMSEAVPTHEVQLISPSVTAGITIPAFSLPISLTMTWLTP